MKPKPARKRKLREWWELRAKESRNFLDEQDTLAEAREVLETYYHPEHVEIIHVREVPKRKKGEK